MAVSDRTWDRLVESEVGNKESRLYGGAQYHRSLREFHLASKCLKVPMITEDEIANAAGVGETHDGVNFLQASCVIAIEKARISFEPMLQTLVFRMTHVMGRLFPVTEYMLREQRDRAKVNNFKMPGKAKDNTALEDIEEAMDISQNPQFREVIRGIYEQFVEDCANSVMTKCHQDLKALTKYVTWNLDQRGSGALARALPDQTNLFAVYQVAVKKQERIEARDDSADHHHGSNKRDNKKGKSRGKDSDSRALTPVESSPPNRLMASPQNQGAMERDYHNLVQIMEEVAMSRHANRTNIVVGGLVQHIVSHWREQFSKAVTAKYNCFFMLPFVDDLQAYLRLELQKVYNGDPDGGGALSDFFDLTAARQSLELQRDELLVETMVNKQLQDKFQMLSRMMRKQKERDSGLGMGIPPPTKPKK